MEHPRRGRCHLLRERRCSRARPSETRSYLRPPIHPLVAESSPQLDRGVHPEVTSAAQNVKVLLRFDNPHSYIPPRNEKCPLKRDLVTGAQQ